MTIAIVTSNATLALLNRVQPFIASARPLNAPIGDATFGTTTTATAFVYQQTTDFSATRVDGTGFGLTYDSNGVLTGGTIIDVAFSQVSAVGSNSVTLQDVNRPVSEIIVPNIGTLLQKQGTPVIQNDGIDPLPRFGTAGNDVLTGDPQDNVLIGLGGDDTLISFELNDVLLGNEGNDSLDAGGGNDQLFGGFGNDQLFGGAGNDVLFGEDGNDLLVGDALGTAGNDTLFGGNGNDTIFGGFGNDYAEGGNGADVIYGETGNDVLLGGLDNDVIFGGVGTDVVLGESGNDTLFGENGDDFLNGGVGNDSLDGGFGADFLEGGDGNDQLFGAQGNDILVGGAGNDLLAGGDGTDFIIAGAGIDVVQGGAGLDIFKIEGGSGQNFWSDFEDGLDRIDVSFIGGRSLLGTAVTVEASGPNSTVVSYLDTQVILEGIDPGLINADDFFFAEAEAVA